MKVLGLVGPTGACFLYRHLIPANALNQRGFDFRTTNVIFEKMFDRINFQPEVIYCQRVDSPRVLNMIYNWKVPWIYDIDDDYYHIPKWNPAHSLTKLTPRIELFMKHARLVTVSTPYLAKLYSPYGKTKIIPNALPDEWKDLPAFQHSSPTLTIGWAGSATHSKDLEVVVKALRKLKKKYDFQLMFFGYLPEWSTEFKSIFIRPVPIQRYIDVLITLPFDIALAPLVDNQFNRSKSNIKILEYGFSGFPVIASRVGEYAKAPDPVIKVDNTPQEWYEALIELVKDKEGRKKRGLQLREWVMETHLVSKVIHLWEEAFQWAKP